MAERSLRGCSILVVEDEYMLADELEMELDDAGAVVIGPVGTVKDALALIKSEQRLDGAVLDVSLRGDLVFPAADLLVEREVPFVFTTGYDASTIPGRFQQIVRCEKPVNIKKIALALGKLIDIATR